MFRKKVLSASENANAPFNCAWWAKQTGKNNISIQAISVRLRMLESEGKLFKYADNPYAVVQFFPAADITTNEILSELARML